MPRLKNHFEFMAGVYVRGELYFNKYSLTVDFYTLSGTALDQNTATDRMAYFVYDTVSRSVFINEGDVAKINALTKAGVSTLTVPDPGPFDPVVLAAIVTKMNAILEDVLVITDAEMVSDMSGPIVYIWDSSDDDDEVHHIVNVIDDTKWWASPAPRFSSYPEDVNVDELEVTSPFPLTWDLLDLAWESDESTESPTVTPSFITAATGKKQGTVIKANFTGNKPKK